MKAKTKKKRKVNPSPKQLRARRAFARMARNRAKEARAAKRVAKRNAATKARARTTKRAPSRKTRAVTPRVSSGRGASRARTSPGRPATKKRATPPRSPNGKFASRRRRNPMSVPPSLASLHQEFQGRPVQDVILAQAPKGTPDELVLLGVLDEVTYETVKDHLDGELVAYTHEFGEEGGDPPLLCADGDGNLFIVGGDYTIAAEGIRD